MKKLNITKEQFNHSKYFKNKYGELEYVSESGKLFKTNKGKVLRFNESADQTLEDIIDNIVTLSILERDAESAESMFQDLKQELSNMGLFSGQIDEDFNDFHAIAIDFAEHHNFNKQFVERAAVTLKSEIERGLSGNEFRESTRRARRSARRFNESDLMNDQGKDLEYFGDKLNGIYEQLKSLQKEWEDELRRTDEMDSNYEFYLDQLESANEKILRVWSDIQDDLRPLDM